MLISYAARGKLMPMTTTPRIAAHAASISMLLTLCGNSLAADATLVPGCREGQHVKLHCKSISSSGKVKCDEVKIDLVPQNPANHIYGCDLYTNLQIQDVALDMTLGSPAQFAPRSFTFDPCVTDNHSQITIGIQLQDKKAPIEYPKATINISGRLLSETAAKACRAAK